MEIIGKVKLVKDVQNINDSFKKRELIITTDEKYPQSLLFEFVQDNVALLDSYSQDEEVKVYFDVRGREWVNPQGETKYFNSLRGWKLEKLSGNTQPEQPLPNKIDNNSADSNNSASSEDDLPF